MDIVGCFKKKKIAPKEDGLLVYLHRSKGQVVCISGGVLKFRMSPLKLGIAMVTDRQEQQKAQEQAVFRGDMGGCLHGQTPLMSNFFLKKWHDSRHTFPPHAGAFFWVVCGVSEWYYSSPMIWEFQVKNETLGCWIVDVESTLFESWLCSRP